MQYLKDFDFKPLSILKVAGVALIALVVLTLAFRLVTTTFKTVVERSGYKGISSSAPASYGYDSDEMYAESAAYGGGAPTVSLRNIAPVPPYDGGTTTGNMAEEFEVTEYQGSIKTRDLAGTCAMITDLKKEEYVIFENANEYERGCNYSFKVENDHAEGILAIINGLNPDSLSETT